MPMLMVPAPCFCRTEAEQSGWRKGGKEGGNGQELGLVLSIKWSAQWSSFWAQTSPLIPSDNMLVIPTFAAVPQGMTYRMKSRGQVLDAGVSREDEKEDGPQNRDIPPLPVHGKAARGQVIVNTVLLLLLLLLQSIP